MLLNILGSLKELDIVLSKLRWCKIPSEFKPQENENVSFVYLRHMVESINITINFQSKSFNLKILINDLCEAGLMFVCSF